MGWTMSYQIKKIKGYFKLMNTVIDDMTPVFTFDSLCTEVGITEREFKKNTEFCCEDAWFTNEYDFIIAKLIKKLINWGMKNPGSAAMCFNILKNFYGIGEGISPLEDFSKVEVTRTIINKRENIEIGL